MMLFTCNRIQSLNNSELEVYHCIVNLGDKVLNMKIRELAVLAHVSVTVVWNFCKKMDCDGWTEFKFKYKESLQERKDAPQRNDYESFITSIQCLTEEVQAKISEVAVVVEQARKVMFIGQGTSGVMAKYGAIYLTSMGKSAQYTDTQYYPIPSEDHHDAAVIGLSVSGETLSVVELLSIKLFDLILTY